MKRSWIEQAGGKAAIEEIADDIGVELSQNILQLLEQFGSLLEEASHSQNSGYRRKSRALADVASAVRVIDQEVEKVRQNLSHSENEVLESLEHGENIETGLPFVTCKLKGFPELFIHVSKKYGTHGSGVSYGFGKREFRKRMQTASGAAAANKLDEYCRSRNWDVSVESILSTWLQASTEIAAEMSGASTGTVLSNSQPRYGATAGIETSRRKFSRYKAKASHTREKFRNKIFTGTEEVLAHGGSRH